MFCNSDYKDQLAQEEFSPVTVSPSEIKRRREANDEAYKEEESLSDISIKAYAFIGTVALFGAAGAAVGNTTGNTLDGALYTGAFGAIAAAVVAFSERQNNQS